MTAELPRCGAGCGWHVRPSTVTVADYPDTRKYGKSYDGAVWCYPCYRKRSRLERAAAKAGQKLPPPEPATMAAYNALLQQRASRGVPTDGTRKLRIVGTPHTRILTPQERR